MNKPPSHAKLVIIDSLQFVEHLIISKARSSSFGCASLRLISIEPREPTPKALRHCDWAPPSSNRLALHCVGSSGSTCSTGSILRDHKGNFINAVVGSISFAHMEVVDVMAIR